MFKFNYIKYKNGRIGNLITPHGTIQTPAFIFCATKGTIKGMSNLNIPNNTQIILCNTFHLQDYSENIQQLGGIHKFIGFNGPIITDSGGFQIFSMGHGSVAEEIKGIRKNKSHIIKINEDGCTFKSPINGNLKYLSAEESIKIQQQLGVDFIVSFDECTASHSTYNYTKKSMERSHRWETRSLEYYKHNCNTNKQKIYGIIQGGIYEELRDQSIQFVNENEFFGVCIGGSLGKSKNEMYSVVKYTAEKINPEKPIHLLGIGRIEDIWELAPYIDTFDCVEPTRIGRHGVAIIPKGRINLRNSIHKLNNNPIDPTCKCRTCQNYSIAYLHYLIKVKETTDPIIEHNIYTMNRMMIDIRYGISENKYNEMKNFWI